MQKPAFSPNLMYSRSLSITSMLLGRPKFQVRMIAPHIQAVRPAHWNRYLVTGSRLSIQVRRLGGGGNGGPWLGTEGVLRFITYTCAALRPSSFEPGPRVPYFPFSLVPGFYGQL